MFHYPLPLPRKTTYELLAIGPEATTEEIREAITDLKVALTAEKKVVDQEIAEIHTKLPAIPQLEAQLEAAQKDADTANPEELQRMQRQLRELEKRAAQLHPQYPELCTRREQLGNDILKTSQISLENPTERLNYDRSSPPLELLKLAECRYDTFTDTRLALILLRRELSAFFSSEGERVFHPSDLTREDFRGDFQHHPLIDGT